MAAGMMRPLLLCLSLLLAAPVQGAAPPQSFPEIEGDIYATLVSGGFLIIGGDFEVNGTPRNLAQIDLEEGSVNLQWGGAGANGPVHALALSVNGNVLYAGGEFDQVNNVNRQNLAAIGLLSGVPVSGWEADVDGPVYALTRSGNGLNLYVGGDFTMISGVQRSNIASVAINNGAARPWVPEADGPVLALAMDDVHGQVFAGGEFTVIGGETFSGLAAIGVTSARARSWTPALSIDAIVRALIHEDGSLYVGGGFAHDEPAPGDGVRNNLAAFEVSSGAIVLADWEPPDNVGVVRALALDADGGRLYAGGEFLVAYRLEPFDDEDRVQPWAPDTAAIAPVHALALGAGQAFLYAGGLGVFAYPVALPLTELDPPPGGQQELFEIGLTCIAHPGLASGGIDCERICHTFDEDLAPLDWDCNGEVTSGQVIQVPFPDTLTATLRFFSEDSDGNREPLRTAAYAIDNLPPVTTATPLPLADGAWFGRDNFVPIVLECDDNFIAFGCTTLYTLDGSEPTTGSTVYSAPIVLGDPGEATVDVVELRFFSVDDAGNPESVQSLEYRIDLAPPVVTVSQPSGTYLSPLTLELFCDDGAGSGCAAVYYTTDDSDPQIDADGNPVASTARYEGPLSLTSATVLKVLALDEAGNASRQTLGIYALSEPGQETERGVGALSPWLLAGLLGLGMLRLFARTRRANAGSGASR